MKLSNAVEYVESRLWIGPLVGLIAASAAAVGTLYADAALADDMSRLFARLDIITGDPDAARSILTVIAGAMVSLLVFTFTMTMVVIQLASAQYTPRLMRSVFRDRITKVCLTLFMSTFAYSLIVLRSVVDRDGRTVVPEVSLASTYVLVIVSLFFFIIYIHHVANTMRVGTVIDRVTDETSRLVKHLDRTAEHLRGRLRPEEASGPGHPIRAATGGALSHVSETALVDCARKRDLRIDLLHRIGDHVAPGAILARIHGVNPAQEDERAICQLITLARQRTMQQDIAYGFRQLVDIANRALSPGINDPTTAVQCIDGLHDLLRRLLAVPDLPTVLLDDEGQERLVVPRFSWDDYVELATTEIRIYGAGSPQIPNRLETMLRDLLEAAPPERIPALERALADLEATVALEVDRRENRRHLAAPPRSQDRPQGSGVSRRDDGRLRPAEDWS